jgi:hypothetical protein
VRSRTCGERLLQLPTILLNIFGNSVNGIDKKTKATIKHSFSGMYSFSGMCAYLFGCLEIILFLTRLEAFFLQVILLARYWIDLWSFLLPSD